MKLKTKPQTEDIKEEMTSWAKARISDPNTLILDLETTGILSRDPETKIVQISIINTESRPVFSALINPERPIPLDAQKIHGINDRMVMRMPSFAAFGPVIADIIRDKHVVAYNASFDIHTLVHTFGLYGIEIPDFASSCAMEAYSAWCGDWMSSKGGWKWQKLPKLAYGSAHDSLVDCVSTLMLMKKMAGDFSDEPPVSEIDLDF